MGTSHGPWVASGRGKGTGSWAAVSHRWALYEVVMETAISLPWHRLEAEIGKAEPDGGLIA